MKKITKKISTLVAAVSVAVMTMSVGVFASTTTTAAEDQFDKAINPIVKLINQLLTPVLALVGAGGALFCVFLGVKFAKADDPQEHEKAKKALKNAIIGFLLIFILMLALKLFMPLLEEWVKNTNMEK